MSVRRHLAWMAISQVLFFLVQFIASVFITRLLSPYEMGVYTAAVATIGLLSTIQAFGLSGFIVREPQLNENLIATAFTINALCSIILMSIILSVSALAGYLLNEKSVTHVMRLLAILPVLGIFEFLPASNLEREARFEAIALVSAGQIIVSQSIAVSMAFAGFSYMSMVYGQIGGCTFSMIAYNIVGKKHVNIRFNLGGWRRISQFSIEMIAINGFNAISARMADILLGRIVGLSALGIYGRASNLNNLLWSNIHLVIARVLFVDLAARVRRRESLRESYLEILEVLTALLWPGFAGLSIISGPFILAVFGPKWIAASHPLVMLTIASMILTSISLTWEVFVARQETGRQAKIEFIRTGVGLAMFAFGCLFGTTGAATARVAEALVAAGLYRPHLDRMTDTRFDDFVPIFQRSAMLTIAAIFPAALTMTFYKFSERAPLIPVTSSIVTGIALWMISIHVLRHPIKNHANSLLKNISRRIFKLQYNS